jgi:deoxyribodipyrimidine photolyase-related protein
MGWREFVRGIYQNFSEVQDSKNFFKHERKLTKNWYEGTTGSPPVDDAIKKALKYGYCHHIERLMILSNIMLLSEIHPEQVHRWFMEMFVDSADWVMGPNVYGMGQFSDGGIFATKPYISGSNYILKMSDYKKGDWCDIWDGLFWRFVGKNSGFLAKNYRMSMMVKTFEKMDATKKKKLMATAESFIQEMTVF